jgi:hypothetical protein
MAPRARAVIHVGVGPLLLPSARAATALCLKPNPLLKAIFKLLLLLVAILQGGPGMPFCWLAGPEVGVLDRRGLSGGLSDARVVFVRNSATTPSAMGNKAVECALTASLGAISLGSPCGLNPLLGGQGSQRVAYARSWT